jgi:hypothetical protein
LADLHPQTDSPFVNRLRADSATSALPTSAVHGAPGPLKLRKRDAPAASQDDDNQPPDDGNTADDGNPGTQGKDPDDNSNGGKGAFRKAADWTGDQAKRGVHALGSSAETVVDTAGTAAEMTGNGMATVGQTLRNGIPAAVDTGTSLVGKTAGATGKAAKGIWDTGGGILQGGWHAGTSLVGGVANLVTPSGGGGGGNAQQTPQDDAQNQPQQTSDSDSQSTPPSSNPSSNGGIFDNAGSNSGGSSGDGGGGLFKRPHGRRRQKWKGISPITLDDNIDQKSGLGRSTAANSPSYQGQGAEYYSPDGEIDPENGVSYARKSGASRQYTTPELNDRRHPATGPDASPEFQRNALQSSKVTMASQRRLNDIEKARQYARQRPGDLSAQQRVEQLERQHAVKSKHEADSAQRVAGIRKARTAARNRPGSVHAQQHVATLEAQHAQALANEQQERHRLASAGREQGIRGAENAHALANHPPGSTSAIASHDHIARLKKNHAKATKLEMTKQANTAALLKKQAEIHNAEAEVAKHPPGSQNAKAASARAKQLRKQHAEQLRKNQEQQRQPGPPHRRPLPTSSRRRQPRVARNHVKRRLPEGY